MSWGTVETEVWAVLGDGHLHDTYWDGAKWHDWDSLGAPQGVTLVGQPAAAFRGTDRIDVFAAGGDGRIWRRWWDGTQWVQWRELAGAPERAQHIAAAWVGTRLDLYVRDDRGDLWYLALSP